MQLGRSDYHVDNRAEIKSNAILDTRLGTCIRIEFFFCKVYMAAIYMYTSIFLSVVVFQVTSIV